MCLARESATPQTPDGPWQHTVRLRGSLPLGGSPTTFFGNPRGAQPCRPASHQGAPAHFSAHPPTTQASPPAPLLQPRGLTARSLLRLSLPLCPQSSPGHTLAGWDRGAAASLQEGKRGGNKSYPAHPSAPLRGCPGWGPHSLKILPSPLRSQDGRPAAGVWGTAGACGPRPPTALPPLALAGVPGWTHLGARAGLRSAAPAAARERVGTVGGRTAGRAGGGRRRRGGDRFMGRAAGRKEALVSQARRIPARGAHLSGQEPGAAAAGPAPRKRLRLPRRPAPRPDPRRRRQGRSRPAPSSPAPGAAPLHLSRLQTRVPGEPRGWGWPLSPDVHS